MPIGFLIAILIFLPSSIVIAKKLDLNNSNIKNKFYILLLVGCFVFIGRNIDRIQKEQFLYGYKPIEDTYYELGERHFLIQKAIDEVILNIYLCKIKDPQCSKKINKSVNFSYGKYTFINK